MASTSQDIENIGYKVSAMMRRHRDAFKFCEPLKVWIETPLKNNAYQEQVVNIYAGVRRKSWKPAYTPWLSGRRAAMWRT
jgi:hypothetical protein